MQNLTDLLNLEVIACRALLEVVYGDNETKTNGLFDVSFCSLQTSQVPALGNHFTPARAFPGDLGLLAGGGLLWAHLALRAAVYTSGTEGVCAHLALRIGVHIWH